MSWSKTVFLVLCAFGLFVWFNGGAVDTAKRGNHSAETQTPP